MWSVYLNRIGKLFVFELVKKKEIRSLPGCPKPLFQIEAKCKAINIKMMFYSHANRTK